MPTLSSGSNCSPSMIESRASSNRPIPTRARARLGVRVCYTYRLVADTHRKCPFVHGLLVVTTRYIPLHNLPGANLVERSRTVTQSDHRLLTRQRRGLPWRPRERHVCRPRVVLDRPWEVSSLERGLSLGMNLTTLVSPLTLPFSLKDLMASAR